MIGLVIAGTAVNMDVFIVGRFVHGLSGAAVIVPLYVIVGRIYPEHLRARVFAGFAAAWVIPSIIGPALAGVVAEALSWHWVFLGVIGLLVPAAAMMLPPILRVRDQVQGDPSVAWSLSRVGLVGAHGRRGPGACRCRRSSATRGDGSSRSWPSRWPPWRRGRSCRREPCAWRAACRRR